MQSMPSDFVGFLFELKCNRCSEQEGASEICSSSHLLESCCYTLNTLILCAERVACNWSSAESWVGALCYSSSRAPHHAIQEAPELPTAAGKPRSTERACC